MCATTHPYIYIPSQCMRTHTHTNTLPTSKHPPTANNGSRQCSVQISQSPVVASIVMAASMHMLSVTTGTRGMPITHRHRGGKTTTTSCFMQHKNKRLRAGEGLHDDSKVSRERKGVQVMFFFSLVFVISLLPYFLPCFCSLLMRCVICKI